MKQSVIVVIPTYGPLHHVERCIQSLAKCRRVDELEIIVVHSGPVPLESPLSHPGMCIRTIQSSEQLFPGTARNLGVRSAKNCNLILFIDADCVADPDWIDAHLTAQDQGAEIVAGPVLPGPPENPSGFAEYLVEFAVTRRTSKSGEIFSVPACNLSIKRALFDKVGCFPSNPVGQDLLFNLRLRAKGYRITFTQSATVFHSCRSKPAAYLANRARIGRGLGKVTRQAEQEGLLGTGTSAEYRFLKVICRSPYGVLLLPSKLFRLAVLILHGDLSLLKYILHCPFSLLWGLWLEGRSCRSGYLEGSVQ